MNDPYLHYVRYLCIFQSIVVVESFVTCEILWATTQDSTILNDTQSFHFICEMCLTRCNDIDKFVVFHAAPHILDVLTKIMVCQNVKNVKIWHRDISSVSRFFRNRKLFRL